MIALERARDSLEALGLRQAAAVLEARLEFKARERSFIAARLIFTDDYFKIPFLLRYSGNWSILTTSTLPFLYTHSLSFKTTTLQ